MESTNTYNLLQCAYRVHSELGPGLLESTYEPCFEYELLENGFLVQRQVSLPVEYRGIRLDAGYRIDMLINKEIIIENKAVERLNEVHFSQILTYLKLSGFELGYLINFNVRSLKDGIRRVINSPL